MKWLLSDRAIKKLERWGHKVDGMGRGEKPGPKRRRMLGGAQGAPGVSGVYVCTLSTDMGAGSIATPATIAGTVHSIGDDAVTTSLGGRMLFSHLNYSLSSNQTYYCDLIGTLPASDPDAQFVVRGAPYPAVLTLDLDSDSLDIDLEMTTGDHFTDSVEAEGCP